MEHVGLRRLLILLHEKPIVVIQMVRLRGARLLDWIFHQLFNYFAIHTSIHSTVVLLNVIHLLHLGFIMVDRHAIDILLHVLMSRLRVHHIVGHGLPIIHHTHHHLISITGVGCWLINNKLRL